MNFCPNLKLCNQLRSRTGSGPRSSDSVGWASQELAKGEQDETSLVLGILSKNQPKVMSWFGCSAKNASPLVVSVILQNAKSMTVKTRETTVV